MPTLTTLHLDKPYLPALDLPPAQSPIPLRYAFLALLAVNLFLVLGAASFGFLYFLN